MPATSRIRWESILTCKGPSTRCMFAAFCDNGQSQSNLHLCVWYLCPRLYFAGEEHATTLRHIRAVSASQDFLLWVNFVRNYRLLSEQWTNRNGSYCRDSEWLTYIIVDWCLEQLLGVRFKVWCNNRMHSVCQQSKQGSQHFLLHGELHLHQESDCCCLQKHRWSESCWQCQCNSSNKHFLTSLNLTKKQLLARLAAHVAMRQNRVIVH